MVKCEENTPTSSRAYHWFCAGDRTPPSGAENPLKILKAFAGNDFGALVEIENFH